MIHRGADKSLPMLCEFLGGKIETRDTLENALQWEIQEELPMLNRAPADIPGVDKLSKRLIK